MMLGMSLPAFTVFHTVLSLIGIGAGIIVLLGMLTGKSLGGWTVVFLSSTIATGVTGFGFPFTQLLPSHIVGIVLLVALGVAVYARYVRHFAGRWRWIYVLTATAAVYLNVFVGVVQAFQKLPFLQPLAPTQSEPPFQITQLAVLAFFVVAGAIAAFKFRPVDAAA